MLRSDRLTSTLRDHPVTSAIRGHRKSLIFVGTALALAGAGTANAATINSGGSAPPLSALTARAGHADTSLRPIGSPATSVLTGPAAANHTAPPQHAAFRQTVPADAARKPAVATTTARQAPHRAVPQVLSWRQVRAELNQQTNPVAAAHGQVPLADRLAPVPCAGPQAWMPLSSAQRANATTIVRQALAKKMGVRSAVIAVATAMQESRLLDIDYGTGDSVGLFQQQWDMGWGTRAQIMNPRFASDAFLTALQQYQAGNPGWAGQPLWQAAQGVQKSGSPFAYAKWEAQAMQLVRQIAMRLR